MDTELAELEYAKRTAACLMDNIARPALLLTGDCAVIHLNGRAQRAIERKRGLMTTPLGRLVLQNRAETIQLQQLVSEAVIGGSSASNFLIFSVPGELSPNSMLIHPMVFASDRSSFEAMPAPAPQALVTVHYRQDSHSLPEERVRKAFGFTHSETQVVLALIAGKTVSQLAEETGRSIHTMRLHLKRALSKADCHSQSELMKVLLRTIGQPI